VTAFTTDDIALAVENAYYAAHGIPWKDTK